MRRTLEMPSPIPLWAGSIFILLEISSGRQSSRHFGFIRQKGSLHALAMKAEIIGSRRFRRRQKNFAICGNSRANSSFEKKTKY